MNKKLSVLPVNQSAYHQLKTELDEKNVTIVAVSKTKPVEDIKALYDLGHRDFGENYVQELSVKANQLPRDIRWHFIGHLQSNKVKIIAPFVQLIHGVDSLKLLQEIDKQAAKMNRTVDCLLQVHIAEEETKFGLDETELQQLMRELDKQKITHASVCGLMGMASFTDDTDKVRAEFNGLKRIYDGLQTMNYELRTLSMGMSADYKIAVAEGSNMVRIGSLLFGDRK